MKIWFRVGMETDITVDELEKLKNMGFKIEND